MIEKLAIIKIYLYVYKRRPVFVGTCVCILHQDPQCVRVYSLHLHLILLGFSNIAGEHGSKVVRHGREDESVRTEIVSGVSTLNWQPWWASLTSKRCSLAGANITLSSCESVSQLGDVTVTLKSSASSHALCIHAWEWNKPRKWGCISLGSFTPEVN